MLHGDKIFWLTKADANYTRMEKFQMRTCQRWTEGGWGEWGKMDDTKLPNSHNVSFFPLYSMSHMKLERFS